MKSFLKQTSVCVIIPMFNEEVNAAECVKKVCAVLKKQVVKSKLLVVDDGSSDKTPKLLQQLKRKYSQLLVVTHKENQGYGAALETGIQEAARRGFEYCLFMDSDLTNPPRFIPHFFRALDPEVDCIKASRYMKNGGMEGVPAYRQWISRVGNLIASSLFGIGIRDCTNGFRLVRTSLLKDIKLKQKNFAMILEELYYLKKKKAKFIEIPTVLTSRKTTASHFNYTPGIFWDYLKYALLAFLLPVQTIVQKVTRGLLYNPVNARVAYDLAVAAMSVGIITGYFLFFELPIPEFVYLVSFPFLFVFFNFFSGIYTIHKTSPILSKTALLLGSCLLLAAVPGIFSQLSVGIGLASTFLFFMSVLPRWCFNFNQGNRKTLFQNVNLNKLPVLVVGGAGYIGTHVVEKLLERGYKVRILDKFMYGREPIADFENNPLVEVIEGDVTDIFKLTLAVEGVQAVVHLAGLVGDPACAVDEKLTRHINIVSTRMLKETAKAFRIPRFVFASSCSVYGSNDEVVDEKSGLNPVSLYARTKIDSEEELLKEQFDEFHPTILRFATVFGHSRRMRFDLVANLFTAQAYENGLVTVMGNNQWRPFIHVSDVAEAVVQAVIAPLDKVSRQVFNVGDDRLNITIGDLGRLVGDVVKTSKHNKPVKVEVKDNSSDRRNYHVSFQKIREVLGFSSQVLLPDGIEEIYQNFKDKEYKKKYTDTVYSNVEVTKSIKDEFYSSVYRQTHYTDMSDV